MHEEGTRVRISKGHNGLENAHLPDLKFCARSEWPLRAHCVNSCFGLFALTARNLLHKRKVSRRKMVRQPVIHAYRRDIKMLKYLVAAKVSNLS